MLIQECLTLCQVYMHVCIVGSTAEIKGQRMFKVAVSLFYIQQNLMYEHYMWGEIRICNFYL